MIRKVIPDFRFVADLARRMLSSLQTLSFVAFPFLGVIGLGMTFPVLGVIGLGMTFPVLGVFGLGMAFPLLCCVCLWSTHPPPLLCSHIRW